MGRLLSAALWVLVAGSVVVITGSLLGRPLLLAAVPTGSMVPTIQPGDLVVVLPTWLMRPPTTGDVVVFKTAKDRDWIVHRIVDGNAVEGFVTKGDANPLADNARVLPPQIAGVVPQWQGRIVRLPGLGLLRGQDSPLSSPIVAGLALAIGLYLLVLPAKPRRTLARLEARRRSRPEAVLGLYLSLATVVFLATLIPAWAMSTNQPIKYEIVASLPANVEAVGRYVAGTTHVERVSVQNHGVLPLLVQFVTSDAHVVYTPAAAIVAAGGEGAFDVTITNAELGDHEASVRMGVLLPLLPSQLLVGLGQRSLALAAIVNAAVPASLLLVIALCDARSQLALRRLRLRLAVTFSL